MTPEDRALLRRAIDRKRREVVAREDEHSVRGGARLHFESRPSSRERLIDVFERLGTLTQRQAGERAQVYGGRLTRLMRELIAEGAIEPTGRRVATSCEYRRSATR